jgi:hypothetical protein
MTTTIVNRVAVKPPFHPPFSKEELFSIAFVPSLEKRGKEEICGHVDVES